MKNRLKGHIIPLVALIMAIIITLNVPVNATTREQIQENMKTATMGEWKVSTEFEPLECDMGEELQEFIFYLCKANSIDFEFVMGVIKTESEFKSDAVHKNANGSKDYGLFQINSCNHSWLSEELGITSFLDPYENAMAGVFVLRSLFEKYDDPAIVLMSYNMGENGASALWKKEIYESDYTKKVFSNIESLKGDIDEGEGLSATSEED